MAAPAPLPDEDLERLAKPCRCEQCEVQRGMHAELAQRGATQATFVWTMGAEPGHKAYVALESGRILIGVGHSDAQAIVNALSSDTESPVARSVEAPITSRGT